MIISTRERNKPNPRSEGLLYRKAWSYLSRSGYPQCPARKWCFSEHVTNPILTKLVSSRWADMRLLLICVLWASSASWFINTQNRTSSIFNRHGLGLSITHIYYLILGRADFQFMRNEKMCYFVM